VSAKGEDGCEDCSGFKANPKWHRRFDPRCAQCGGRYLWAIQRTGIEVEKRRELLRKALADWMAMGHAEQLLRELAKRPWAALKG